jgi:hypothetical protein
MEMLPVTPWQMSEECRAANLSKGDGDLVSVLAVSISRLTITCGRPGDRFKIRIKSTGDRGTLRCKTSSFELPQQMSGCSTEGSSVELGSTCLLRCPAATSTVRLQLCRLGLFRKQKMAEARIPARFSKDPVAPTRLPLICDSTEIVGSISVALQALVVRSGALTASLEAPGAKPCANGYRISGMLSDDISSDDGNTMCSDSSSTTCTTRPALSVLLASSIRSGAQ